MPAALLRVACYQYQYHNRQKVLVPFRSLDDPIIIGPATYISEVLCIGQHSKMMFHLRLLQRYDSDIHALSLRIIRDYQIISVLHYIATMMLHHRSYLATQ